MEKLFEMIKRSTKDKKLYLFTMITFLFFGIYFFTQYAPDTYSVFSTELKTIVLHFISCGRVVTGAFVYGLMGILKLKDRGVYLISYGLAMVCTIISMYQLNKMLQKEVKNELISILATILIVINPFSIELFLYVEKGILMLSVLFCILAVKQVKKWFEQDKKKDKRTLLLALLYMIIANCCYQGTVGVFVAISLFYIVKYSKNVIEFIRNNVVVALIYGISAASNFAMVRFVFVNARASGNIIIAESIQKIIKGTQKMFVTTYDLLPQNLFLMVLLVLLGLIIYQALRAKKQAKIKGLEILGAIYLVVGTTCVTLFPQILQDTQSIWFVARSSYPVAALIGLLVVYLASRFEMKIPFKQMVMIGCCLFLSIQYVYFMKITKDNYMVSYQDKQIAEQIKQQIGEYEAKTGKIVTKVAFYQDKYPSYTYPNILATGDMNIKAFSTEWSTMAIMKYYVKKELVQVDKEEKMQEEFQQINWDYYNKEQVILKEDTLHLCLY